MRLYATFRFFSQEIGRVAGVYLNMQKKVDQEKGRTSKMIKHGIECPKKVNKEMIEVSKDRKGKVSCLHNLKRKSSII